MTFNNLVELALLHVLIDSKTKRSKQLLQHPGHIVADHVYNCFVTLWIRQFDNLHSIIWQRCQILYYCCFLSDPSPIIGNACH